LLNIMHHDGVIAVLSKVIHAARIEQALAEKEG
jgi:hypothetical protein